MMRNGNENTYNNIKKKENQINIVKEHEQKNKLFFFFSCCMKDKCECHEYNI